MTGPQLTLILLTPPKQRFDAEVMLQQRFLGLPSVVLLILAMQIGSLVAASAYAHARVLPVAAVTPIAAVAALGASFTFILFQNWFGRRLRRELVRSRLLQAPLNLTLSNEGLVLGYHRLPWVSVGAVQRWNDSTILTFSRADGLVIPDNALPAGMTPEALAAQIADWKAQ